VKILVTFALENEFAPWRELRKFRAASWGRVDGHSAEIGGAEVAVVLTGVGPKPAARKIASVLRGEAGSFGCCISSGLAGGLQPDYKIAQILAARAVVFGEIESDRGGAVTKGSEALISFAAELRATVVEHFVTEGRVITRAGEKKALGEIADAVEMESFEILRAARDLAIPVVAIRGISDLADQDLPLDLSDVFTDDGQLSIPRVMAQVAQRPQAMPSLMRLAQDSKRAATELCRFLDRYVERIAEAAGPLESRAAWG
jgi:adenosylhomocysteine nucleosidase